MVDPVHRGTRGLARRRHELCAGCRPAQIDVERFVIARVTRADQAFQGHREVRLSGKYTSAKLSAQEGAIFIPAAQPLGRLAFYLLEPESDDGLVVWNFIEEGLASGNTYPVYRVVNQTGLKLGQ